MAQAAARPWVWLDGVFAAALRRLFMRRIGRDTALIVPFCIILIFASFAACAFLQIRLDKGHAVAQATLFEQTRALDLARATAASLDHYARMGAVFAAGPEQYRSAEFGRAEPAIGDIAVWDGTGRQLARLDALAAMEL